MGERQRRLKNSVVTMTLLMRVGSLLNAREIHIESHMIRQQEERYCWLIFICFSKKVLFIYSLHYFTASVD